MIGTTQLLTESLLVPGDPIVTDGLVTRLESFNQGYGASTTQWDDLSGNNNHFTKSGNVALTTYGGVSDVWSFTGGYFNFKRPSDNANNGFGVFNLDDYTIEIWFNFVSQYSSNATPWLWSYDYSSHSNPYYYQFMRIASYDNTYISSRNGGTGQTGDISGGNWYQTVSTRVGGSTLRGKAYINGAEVNATANSTRELAVNNGGYNQEAWIGRGNYGTYGGSYTSFLKGAIGIFRFYNRALSAAEVQQNYNGNKDHFGLT